MSDTSPGRELPKLAPADAQSLPTWRAAYADRTAWLMAVFSQLAYIPFVDEQDHPGKGAPKNFRGDGWAELDPYLKDGGFEVRATFNKGNVQSFLAVNPAEFAVLAFRGTANWEDWKINLNAARIPMPGFEAVEVHRGFWAAFEDSAGEIRAAIDANVPSGLGLYITGHSLGGALAQIASVVLERDNLAACYTFGSPRVASVNFDRCVKCPHYRLVNHWDLVPGVPLPTLRWGYRHTGDPRLLTGVKPQAVLRHDHDVVARFVVDLWSALRWLVSRNFSAVDNHMIWNYRDLLKGVETARARPVESRPQA
jgi:hypothetical protein